MCRHTFLTVLVLAVCSICAGWSWWKAEPEADCDIVQKAIDRLDKHLTQEAILKRAVESNPEKTVVDYGFINDDYEKYKDRDKVALGLASVKRLCNSIALHYLLKTKMKKEGVAKSLYFSAHEPPLTAVVANLIELKEVCPSIRIPKHIEDERDAMLKREW